MPGPLPKPPGLRQRKNRASTAATLPSPQRAKRNKVPALPARDRGERWHPRVLSWWKALWQSPMAVEYLDSDRHSLYLLAELYQRFWADIGKGLATIASEIRQQEARFGLSPIDRRRLQWEIERGDQAEERTQRRRGLRDVQGKDPREILRIKGSTPRRGRAARRSATP